MKHKKNNYIDDEQYKNPMDDNIESLSSGIFILTVLSIVSSILLILIYLIKQTYGSNFGI